MTRELLILAVGLALGALFVVTGNVAYGFLGAIVLIGIPGSRDDDVTDGGSTGGP